MEPGFFKELKRRHVWRVAVAYAVAAWLLVQVATQVFPFFDIPNWAVRLIVLVLAIGFPIAMLLAWLYEITPEGLRRTEPADSPGARSERVGHQIGRKLNATIIAVLVLAIALLGWRSLAPRLAPRPAPTAAVVASDSTAGVAASGLREAAFAGTAVPASIAAIPGQSVAVLPFADESGEKDQQYFSDGLSEDLINTLSQIDGLKVIGRNSAFQFRDSKDSSAAIGTKLGVAHLLEGSVRRQGGDVRITATLVNAADGRILWSERYDKPYKDLFQLQNAITSAVAAALKTKLLADHAAAQSEHPPSGNLEAWQAYQRGKFYAARTTQVDTRKAIGEYTLASRLDPRYAAAQAQLSFAWNDLAAIYLSGDAERQAFANARTAADAAFELTPGLALASEARGYSRLSGDLDWRGAEADYQRAAQLAPNDSLVQFGLARLDATLGHVQSAVALTRKALTGDPLHAGSYLRLSQYLTGLGRLDEAQQAIDKAFELQPNAEFFRARRSVVAILRGDAKAALAAAQQEPDPGWRRVALALALQIGPNRKAADAALQILIDEDVDDAAFQIAEVYALRRDPDNTFRWLDRAWDARDGGVGLLLVDPLILHFRDDPRFAAFCKKVGLPTTTDAVAMK